MSQVAFITGITGQDGSYLAELLLKKIIMYTDLFDAHLQLIRIELTIFFMTINYNYIMVI